MSDGKRQKCQQCRLKRCFMMGMKKDYFISEEEKQRRRKRLYLSAASETITSHSQSQVAEETYRFVYFHKFSTRRFFICRNNKI